MSSRRKFIKKAGLAGVIASILPHAIQAQTKKTDSKRSLRIAHITDIHICKQDNAEAFFAQTLREINTMADKPDLIINTGDSVMDENKQRRETVQQHWDTWNKITKAENKIEIKSALGNHDVWFGPDAPLDAEYKSDKRYGKNWAMEELSIPNRYYTFTKNNWQFIALDSINGEDGYQLDEEQFSWLSKTLSDTKPSTPICIFSHVPFLSMGALLYTTKRNDLKDVKFPSGDMHNDHQRIKDLFFKHSNIKVCLSGHVHYIDGLDYLGIKYLCNGAVSGNWWRDPIALDEFPPVYTIIDLFNDGTINYQHIFYTNKI